MMGAVLVGAGAGSVVVVDALVTVMENGASFAVVLPSDTVMMMFA
jgi:hypothetical protein